MKTMLCKMTIITLALCVAVSAGLADSGNPRLLEEGALLRIEGLDLEGQCAGSIVCTEGAHLFPACWFCAGNNVVSRCAIGEGTCNEIASGCGLKTQCTKIFTHTAPCTWAATSCSTSCHSTGEACPDKDCSP